MTTAPAQAPAGILRKQDLSNWAGAFFGIAYLTFILAHTSNPSILLILIVGHEVLASISFLIRRAPKVRPAKWYARASAYLSTYMLPLFIMFIPQWRPSWMATTSNASLRVLGAALWLFGAILSLWAIWYLRRSFSIEPQARELVIRGPYTLARHPIYLSYILQFGGIAFAHPSLPFGLVYCLWFAVQFIRTRFEEQVLLSAFPEYEGYRRQVCMFGPPKFFRHANACIDLLPIDIVAGKGQ